MSAPIGGETRSVEVTEDVTAYYLGKQATGALKASLAGANDAGWGVFQKDTDSGNEAPLMISGETYVIVADATGSVGDRMKSDASGKATAADTDGDEVIVTLREAVTAANQIVLAEITKFQLWVTAG